MTKILKNIDKKMYGFLKKNPHIISFLQLIGTKLSPLFFALKGNLISCKKLHDLFPELMGLGIPNVWVYFVKPGTAGSSAGFANPHGILIQQDDDEDENWVVLSHEVGHLIQYYCFDNIGIDGNIRYDSTEAEADILGAILLSKHFEQDVSVWLKKCFSSLRDYYLRCRMGHFNDREAIYRLKAVKAISYIKERLNLEKSIEYTIDGLIDQLPNYYLEIGYWEDLSKFNK